MSRMSVLIKKFDKNNSNPVKQAASNEFETLLAKSLNVIINQFKDIDNIILMADGGSWRKKLLIPQCLQNTTYKGNRTQAIELDWDYIYKPFNKFFKKCESLGITCCRYEDCEGDDWAWYWSRRLNDDGINCIIWTSDNDIKQLIQYNSDSRAFTAWYNSKNGLTAFGMGDKFLLERLVPLIREHIFNNEIKVYKNFKVGNPLEEVNSKDITKMRLNL